MGLRVCTEGHRLELLQMPWQATVPEEQHLSPELENCLTEEVSKLVHKGAVSLVDHPQPDSFVSRMFLVPKRGQLPQTNNGSPGADKMKANHLLKDLLQKGDWMVKLDLKDAYFAVPIHQQHHQYLQVCWKGKS